MSEEVFLNERGYTTDRPPREPITVGPEQRPRPHAFYGDSYERGLDPWHSDAFRGTPAEGRFGATGERKGGWFLIDGSGNTIGFVLDGTVQP